MNKKIKILLIFASLSLTLGVMSHTYSRYVADTNGNVEIAFAKWQILVNDNDITNNLSSSINLTPVIERNPNVTDNTLAPSSKGFFDININSTNVDVAFNYTININVLNDNMPDLLISKYAILDETYQEGDQVTLNNLENNTITGTQNTKLTKPFTVRVYFEWYEGENELMDDNKDSLIGNDAATKNTTLDINATIKFEQKI